MVNPLDGIATHDPFMQRLSQEINERQSNDRRSWSLDQLRRSLEMNQAVNGQPAPRLSDSEWNALFQHPPNTAPILDLDYDTVLNDWQFMDFPQGPQQQMGGMYWQQNKISPRPSMDLNQIPRRSLEVSRMAQPQRNSFSLAQPMDGYTMGSQIHRPVARPAVATSSQNQKKKGGRPRKATGVDLDMYNVAAMQADAPDGPSREECVQRYLAKRKRRMEQPQGNQKSVRYEVRQQYANVRPRIKGRFVKSTDPEERRRKSQQTKAPRVRRLPL